MNIGLLTTYLALDDETDSGIGQHYRILADALAGQGHHVHVVHPTLRPEAAAAALAALAPRWTCDIVPVRTPQWLDRMLRRSWPSRVLMADLCAALAAARALHRAGTRHALEIIETHATSAPALGYLHRRHHLPVVTRVSTTMSQLNTASSIHSRIRGWQAAVERFAVRGSDSLVTHTATHRDTICALDGYRPDAFTIIPHGLPDIRPTAAASPASGIHILFVGRFEHRKGIDVLLAAIPPVLARHPAARITLAGSHGDGVAWAGFVRSHPELAGSRVQAPGRVTGAELDTLYSHCDILVAPSRYESFGLIYVEAMRHAKPVIGCAAGGIPEVVTDGITGLLAQPGDTASLVSCLERLLGDPTMRLRMGQAGREDFLRRFSADTMARRSVDHYHRVLAAWPHGFRGRTRRPHAV